MNNKFVKTAKVLIVTGAISLVVILFGNLLFPGRFSLDKKTELTWNDCRALEGYKVKDGKVKYIDSCILDDGCGPIGCALPSCVCMRGNELEMADAGSLKKLGLNHAKDKNHVYSFGQVVEGADPNTFEHIDGQYWKDSSSVFGYKEKFIGAEVQTFKVIDAKSGLTKDAFHTYHHEKIIGDGSAHPYKDFGSYYVSWNNVLFYFGSPVPGADAESFQLLGNDYASDGSHIYVYGKVIEGVDMTSFGILNASGCARDATNFYYYGRKDEGSVKCKAPNEQIE